MSVKTEAHCRFREEDGICAILKVTDATPQKPLCRFPKATTETCEIVINWRNLPSNPVDAGLVPPMGEID